ncbi:MAG: transcription antitermination factor NusB [Algisphaera sp.]
MSRTAIRRLAMQVLFQIDATGDTDATDIFDGLDTDHDPLAVRQAAVKLALAAWADHDNADTQVAQLTPEWPTHRQPPVDRAILRLAWHEMIRGIAPGKVVINESVNLAKDFSSPKSPSFINGVLDKIMKSSDMPEETTPQPDAGEWLDDAADTPSSPD